jgi:hypothetical protein
MIDVERLRQIFVRTALKRRDRALQIRIRGHDDDGHVRKTLLRLLQ